MNNYSNFIFPSVVFEAFPILKKLQYIRQFASLVPLNPDTTFHLFGGEDGHFLVLVMTDYADPIDQSQELKNISGEYAFEFTKLIRITMMNILKSKKTTICLKIRLYQTLIAITVFMSLKQNTK